MRRLELVMPSLCLSMGSVTREADFGASAKCGPLTVVEAPEAPLPAEWMRRFSAEFELEHRREGDVSATSELELQVAMFRDVWVFGHTGQIVDTGTGRSITPVHRGSTMPGLLRARRLDGVAFSLFTGVPGKRRNYYHFLMESIPEKLEALRLAVEAFGHLTLLLPTSDHPLDVALVSEARRQFPGLPVQQLRKSERLRCESVVFHRVRRSSMFRSPASGRLLSLAVEAMRHSFQTFPEARESMGNLARRRLFVSRADAGKRRLLNEDDALRRIEHLGFQHVMPGRLPVEDQVAVFSEAQIIAGPHGAGLTNLIFMPEGGAVVENFHPGWVQGAFAWLSHLTGQTYGHVVADKLATDLDYQLSGVGLDAFEREVEAALERVTATKEWAGTSVPDGERSSLRAKESP